MCAFKKTTGNHRQNHLRTLLPTLALPALLWTGGCNGGIHDVTGSASSELLVERPKELRPEVGHVAPPAGGTTVVSRDSSVAVVSEPVLSQLLIVDLNTKVVTKRIELRPGDNPGRCVEGAVAGEFFCVLRTGSAVVRIRAQQDPWVPLQRAFVCAEPRGIAFAQTDQTLRVACDGGELVTMQTQRGALSATLSQQLEAGLDDVLLMPDAATESEIWVSRKRRAKVIRLSRTSGKLLGATEPPSDPKATTATTTAARLLRDPHTGGAFLLHEVGSLLPLRYYGGCVNCAPSLRAMDLKGNLSPSALTLLGQGKEHLTVPLDLAFRDDAIAVVAAGNRSFPGRSDGRSTVWLGDRTKLTTPISLPREAMAIAVAATKDRFVVQTIGRSSLWLVSASQPSKEIVLDSRPQSIRGVELFYASDPSIGLACASCHPDGKDDGHKWQLKISPTDQFHSRTLSLLGTLEDRTVFRRTGTFPSLLALVKSDLASLSPGKPVEDADSASLTAWLLALKAPWVMAPASEAAQLAQGKALYDATCARCHGTDKPTSRKVLLTSGAPALVSPLLTDLNNRAPYLHDGCATTLDNVFDGTCPLAGDVHRLPNSTAVESSRLQALRAYLVSR